MTKKMFKKFLTSAMLIALCLTMVASFAGCGESATDAPVDTPTPDTDTPDTSVDTPDASVDTPDTDAEIGTTDPDGAQEGETGEGVDVPDVEPTKKRVALTLDDGPHNVRTQAIVDELAKYGFHATFFVVGNRVDGTAYGGGKTVPYILEHGNEIGIHGYTHEVYYNKCDEATYEYELNATLRAIQSYAPGYEVKLMRPIGGAISAERVASCDYSVIMWSVDSEDWRYTYANREADANSATKVDTIVNNIMAQLHDGAIILMHDIYQSTVDAVVELLARLDAEGYEVVTVSELLGTPEAGAKYYSK